MISFSTVNIPEALKLLAVGMTTVFCILLIVIYFGKALIAIVNKMAPEEQVTKKAAPATSTVIDPTAKAVIDEAVKQITGGKGHVVNIKKI